MSRFINDDVVVVPCRTAARISEQDFIEKLFSMSGPFHTEETLTESQTGTAIANTKVEVYDLNGNFITTGRSDKWGDVGIEDWPDGDFIIRVAKGEPFENAIPNIVVENEYTKMDFLRGAIANILRYNQTVDTDKDVIVDHENIHCDNNESWIEEFPEAKDIIGVHTINGLTFAGVLTGGDWEQLMFMMLYWDGNNIRCYIPKRGNMVNLHTLTALGSEYYNEDYKNILLQYAAETEVAEMPIDDYDCFADDVYMSMYGLLLFENGKLRTEYNNEIYSQYIHDIESLMNYVAIKEDFLTAIQVIN